MRAICNVCCHHCSLEEGRTGACGARTNKGGQITASNYGRLTALALDPIETLSLLPELRDRLGKTGLHGQCLWGISGQEY